MNLRALAPGVLLAGAGGSREMEERTTRNRILEEAAGLFRYEGFNGASMQDLASVVGITKSTLYHHFPSKQALLAEIVELTVDRVTPALEAIAEADVSADARLRLAGGGGGPARGGGEPQGGRVDGSRA